MDEHVGRTMRTYDAIAEHYGVTATPELRAWKEALMRRFASYLLGRTVLVPACGDGRDSRFLSSLGLDVTSFDLSANMLRVARENDPAGEYRRMDLREIRRLPGPYAGVWASGCLYHLAKTEFRDWLKDCRTVLAPNGVLGLSMKEGRGELFEDGPRPGAPGGAEAAKLLRGSRYYAYYERPELLALFSGFECLHEERRTFDGDPAERRGQPDGAVREPAHLDFLLRAYSL